ncbi:MAG: 2-phospho-L-lactate guanylyltransferase, partial [Candidatus Bathyarchaeota archaeon]
SMVLEPEERRTFVLSMLEDVLGVTASSKLNQTVVVGSDPIVQSYAERFGASFFKETKSGLNNSLKYAMEWCVKMGAEAVLILPVDIPLIMAADVNEIIHLLSPEKASIVISPSNDGGTNALMRQPANIIKTCFGSGSFEKHINEAMRKGVSARVYRSPRVSLDIDSIEDLKKFFNVGKGKVSHRFLEQKKIDKHLM